MANLIIWRHAEAEDESASGHDADRALTKRGRKDAAKMAEWLQQHLPANTEIFCSPAKRCQETAAALQQLNRRKNPREIKVADFLNTDSTVEKIAKAVVNHDTKQTILIIGHQPNLGWLIANLLGMVDDSCVVKKGAVWWLRQRTVHDTPNNPQTYLFTVRHPDF